MGVSVHWDSKADVEESKKAIAGALLPRYWLQELPAFPKGAVCITGWVPSGSMGKVSACIDRAWDSLTPTPTPKTAGHKEDLESCQGLVKVVAKGAEN